MNERNNGGRSGGWLIGIVVLVEATNLGDGNFENKGLGPVVHHGANYHIS